MKQVLYNIQRVFHTTEEEMKAIEKVMQVTFLKKDQLFLKENDHCNTIGFIEHGSMRGGIAFLITTCNPFRSSACTTKSGKSHIYFLHLFTIVKLIHTSGLASQHQTIS